MGGQPVWLVSVSRWRNGRNIPTARWGPGVRRAMITVAHQALGDVGQPTVERGFLMCSTLCFHRAATNAEAASIPAGPGGLAGPPFDEVIYETPACPPVALSFRPCANRRYQRLGSGMIPVDDCGACASCEARAAALTKTFNPRTFAAATIGSCST
jgi:hypothetical protein